MSSTRSVPRLRWEQLPSDVQGGFADVLGSPVESADSQEEGFSPGMAARCVLADGRKAFVKATSSSINTHSRAMMVHEGLVNAAFGDDAPVPEFLGSVEVDEWFGLAFADVEGRLPATPWNDHDLELVVAAVDALAVPPVEGIPHLTEVLGPAFQGWDRLATQGADLTDVEPWLDQATIVQLAEISAGWVDACPPEALVHADIRADNLLIEPDGNVLVVDWANAGLGPACLDVVGMIPSIAMQGGPGPSELWARSVHSETAAPADIDAFVVAMAGYFTDAARQPPVAEIPMLRDFQEAQGVWARRWVKDRLDL